MNFAPNMSPDMLAALGFLCSCSASLAVGSLMMSSLLLAAVLKNGKV